MGFSGVLAFLEPLVGPSTFGQKLRETRSPKTSPSAWLIPRSWTRGTPHLLFCWSSASSSWGSSAGAVPSRPRLVLRRNLGTCLSEGGQGHNSGSLGLAAKARTCAPQGGGLEGSQQPESPSRPPMPMRDIASAPAAPHTVESVSVYRGMCSSRGWRRRVSLTSDSPRRAVYLWFHMQTHGPSYGNKKKKPVLTPPPPPTQHQLLPVFGHGDGDHRCRLSVLRGVSSTLTTHPKPYALNR